MQPGIQHARAARRARQGAEFRVSCAEVAEHRVHRRAVVDQPFVDPRRHVQAHAQALVQGGEHARSQQQAPSARAAVVVEGLTDAPYQVGHQVRPVAGVRHREVAGVAHHQLHAVDADGVQQGRDDGVQEGADRLEGEVERLAAAVDRGFRRPLDAEHVPALGELELGMRFYELREFREVVGVVHAQAAQEGHAALVAAVGQHLQRLDPRVQQRQEPPVLRPRVVREAIGAPIGGEALVVAVLDHGIDARVTQQVDPAAQVVRGDRVGQHPRGDGGRIAVEDDAALAARSRRRGVGTHGVSLPRGGAQNPPPALFVLRLVEEPEAPVVEVDHARFGDHVHVQGPVQVEQRTGLPGPGEAVP